MTKLILGTAQFGAGYGITNQVGRIDNDAMGAILAVAQEAGITLFDTAPGYGDAQKRLGSLNTSEVRRQFVSNFGLPTMHELAAGDTELFGSTLTDLRVSELYGLLFHRVSDLRDPRASDAWEQMRSARKSGVVARIGASIYDAEDLEIVAERFPDLDLIQVPGSILDRRLLDHPLLKDLHDNGVEVHVRSAYLQGLLLALPEVIPDYFDGLRPFVARLRQLADERQTSAMGLALAFLKNNPNIDAVLVGATTAAELSSTVAAWRSASDEVFSFEIPELRTELLDPRLWPPRQEKK